MRPTPFPSLPRFYGIGATHPTNRALWALLYTAAPPSLGTNLNAMLRRTTTPASWQHNPPRVQPPQLCNLIPVSAFCPLADFALRLRRDRNTQQTVQPVNAAHRLSPRDAHSDHLLQPVGGKISLNTNGGPLSASNDYLARTSQAQRQPAPFCPIGRAWVSGPAGDGHLRAQGTTAVPGYNHRPRHAAPPVQPTGRVQPMEALLRGLAARPEWAPPCTAS